MMSSQMALSSKALSTLNENEEEQKTENEAEHIQRVKDSMRECLNLGEDSMILSGGGMGMGDAGGMGISLQSHSSRSSVALNAVDAESVEAHGSLQRVEECEQVGEQAQVAPAAHHALPHAICVRCCRLN